MKFFKEYLGKGFIKEQRPSFDQISKQIIRSRKDIIAATKMLENDPEWAATIAYQMKDARKPRQKILYSLRRN